MFWNNLIKNNIKWWLIFWFTALLVFFVWWIVYSAFNPIKINEVSSWQLLSAQKWNELVANINTLNEEFKNLSFNNTNLHYSTEEVLTWNYWIDGKTIYRKCFDTTTNDEILLTNVLLITWIGGTGFSSAWHYPLPYENSSSYTASAVLKIDLDWKVRTRLGGWFNKMIWCVEYTKITD